MRLFAYRFGYSELVIEGDRGVWRGVAFRYEIRGSRIYGSVNHGGSLYGFVHTGLVEQEFGVNFGLENGRDFADSIAISVLLPLGVKLHIPALGSQVPAIEPNAEIGIERYHWRVSVEAGARVFADGGMTQLRARLSASTRLKANINLSGLIFLVRSVRLRRTLSPIDISERADIILAGLRVEYAFRDNYAGYVEYDYDIAGEAGHARERIDFGVTYRY